MTSRPTHIRYLIVLVAMLVAVLLYLERVCLSVAEVFIREDLRIDKDRMGWVFGAFFFAYALGQVPAGWLSQRYGPRNMMALYMLGWSVFGCFIALAQNFWMLFLARFLLGLSQAGAYPTAAILVKRWVPDRDRGMANSIVAFGGRFGGAGANWLTGLLIVAFVPMSTDPMIKPSEILTTKPIVEPSEGQRKEQNNSKALDPIRVVVRKDFDPKAPAESLNVILLRTNLCDNLDWPNVGLASDGKAIVARAPDQRTAVETQRLNRMVVERAFPEAIRQLHTDGWRPTLLLYGGLGIIVGALFFVLARNWPREHPWVNAAERDLIEQGQTAASNGTGGTAVPWGLLVRSRNQWFYSLTQFFSNMGWVFLITLMPRFLSERFNVSVEDRGLMTTIPLFIAAFAMFFGGWATDRLSQRMGKRWGRAIPLGLGKVPCALALAACPFLPTAWAVVFALTIMAASGDFGIPAIWAFAQDTGGKQVGAVLGWGNMWGNFGAGLAARLMGEIEKDLGWDGVLFSGAIVFMLSAMAGMMTNAGKPLFEEKNAS